VPKKKDCSPKVHARRPKNSDGVQEWMINSFHYLLLTLHNLFISSGDLLGVVPHPNVQKYPDQKIMYVRVDDYVYIVPYDEQENRKFLKTIIPSRRATKEFKQRKEL
jgi:hypothetical protein